MWVKILYDLPFHFLYRSFPALFRRSTGKRRFSATKPAAVSSPRGTKINFYLLPNLLTTRTPQGTEELTLLMAGLGKRVIMVPDNSNHSEVIPVNVINDKNVLKWETGINGTPEFNILFWSTLLPRWIGDFSWPEPECRPIPGSFPLYEEPGRARLDNQWKHLLNSLFRRKNCIHTALRGTYFLTTKLKRKCVFFPQK